MLLKERIREYVQSKLQYALTSRTIDIPSKETPSVFGNGIVMHYVSHVPDAASPIYYHTNRNKSGVDHPPRTPVQLAMSHGNPPTPAELNAAAKGNRDVNQILGHNDSGKAVPFFSDKASAEKLASMTGGVARSVVMDANKVGHYMRSAGDYRNSGQSGGYIGVYSHPELGDYFRTANHRSLIDHAQTASLNTTGAGEIHEHIQNEPDNHLHRMALADHLEGQGKAGLADKVRQTVPLHFRRKYAIIRFCRQRLRYAQSSKYGMNLYHADPVEKMTADGSGTIAAGEYIKPGGKLPSGQRSAVVKQWSNGQPGELAEFDPAYLSHISPSELRDYQPTPAAAPTPAAGSANPQAQRPIQNGDYVHAHLPNGERLGNTVYRVASKDSQDPSQTMIQELGGGSPFQHDGRWLSHASQDAINAQTQSSSASAAQQATPASSKPRNPARRSNSNRSPLNAAVLPAADTSHHVFHDHIERIQGAKGKLDTLLGQDHADRARARFADWAGQPVADEHIADMMCVPRPSHLQNNNHPVLYTNLSTSVDRMNRTIVPGQDSLHSMTTVESDDPTYEYYHDNRLKIGADGKPFLYFNIVKHDPRGDKAISMPHILWNAAKAAHANGVKKIKLHAALGGDWVGGVYWPKMGFDHNLMEAYGGDPRTWNSIVRSMQKRPHLYGGIEGKNPTEYTLLDMLHHPTAYKKYFEKDPSGSSYDTQSQYPNARNLRNAYFDTDPNSRSMKILSAYLRKIEGAQSAPPAQQGTTP